MGVLSKLTKQESWRQDPRARPGGQEGSEALDSSLVKDRVFAILYLSADVSEG